MSRVGELGDMMLLSSFCSFNYVPGYPDSEALARGYCLSGAYDTAAGPSSSLRLSGRYI